MQARRNAVWALTRMDDPTARAAVRVACADPSDSVRLTAVTSAGWWRDAEAGDQLKTLAVSDSMPAIRREAATAMGRIGNSDAVPILLEALKRGGDRFTEHAQTYALIRLADRSQTRAGLFDPNPRVNQAALLALDQMDQGGLNREEVLPFLEHADADLQSTALKIAMMRPEWADGVAELLPRWL